MGTKKDLYCVICGKLKKIPKYALCKDCTPFLYKKQGLPHQKATRRKKWRENRNIQIEKVGNKCQWCNSDKQPFSIHHPNTIGARYYDHIWYSIVSDLIKKKISVDAKLGELFNLRVILEKKKALKQRIKARKQKVHNSMVGVCPHCGNSNYNERKTLTPRYRCGSCKKEFDILKLRISDNLARSIKNLETKLKSQDYFTTTVSQNKTINSILPLIYYEARNIYDEVVQQLVSNYEEMKDVIVLCKKCHSAARLGYVICEKCKTNYHSTQYETCFRCHMGEKWEESENDWYDFDEDDWEDFDEELEEDLGKE